jgi:uncharacterized Zn-finger protein
MEREFACGVCNKQFKNNICLKRHTKRVHSKSEPELKNIVCDLCDYKTRRQANLQSHIRFVHLGVKDYVCMLCDYATEYKCNLKHHVLSVHAK